MYRVPHLLRSSRSPLKSSENTTSQPAEWAGTAEKLTEAIKVRPKHALPIARYFMDNPSISLYYQRVVSRPMSKVQTEVRFLFEHRLRGQALTRLEKQTRRAISPILDQRALRDGSALHGFRVQSCRHQLSQFSSSRPNTCKSGSAFNSVDVLRRASRTLRRCSPL